MDKTTLKPLVWLHFGSDEFGFNVKGKFGGKDFLKTNNDFRIVFDEGVANASGDVLSEVSGLWVCTRNTKFMEMMENMPNVKVNLFTVKILNFFGDKKKIVQYRKSQFLLVSNDLAVCYSNI